MTCTPNGASSTRTASVYPRIANLLAVYAEAWGTGAYAHELLMLTAAGTRVEQDVCVGAAG